MGGGRGEEDGVLRGEVGVVEGEVWVGGGLGGGGFGDERVGGKGGEKDEGD